MRGNQHLWTFLFSLKILKVHLQKSMAWVPGDNLIQMAIKAVAFLLSAQTAGFTMTRHLLLLCWEPMDSLYSLQKSIAC
jgi:hypothetical protein